MSEPKFPQAMRPHGFMGRVFGWTMDRLGGKAQDFAVRRLEISPGDKILEIGFGTGRLVKKFAKAAPDGLIAGIDPSVLMFETAEKRTKRLRKKGRVQLRLGDASSLPWGDGEFDKVAALHSFQFWSDPVRDIGEVHRVLKPGGTLLLILRAHGRRVPRWLPNPLSRSSQEIAKTFELLNAHGFEGVRIEGKVGSSAVITARRG